MKNVISFIFLLALLVSGCSQEEMSKNGTSSTSEGRVFTTSFEQNDSRTYVKDGHLSRWTEGDRISLFDASILNCQYLFAGDTGDSGGTFFMLSKPEGTGTALSTNYAVYPYSENMMLLEDGMIILSLPSEQHYAENSYGLGNNTMVAVTENADDTFLKFKNLGGCFKLQLYGDDVTVKNILLTSNNGEMISGTAFVTAAYDEDPVVEIVYDATDFIMLDCGKKGVKLGATEEDATAFWFVVPPTIFENGITVTVKSDDNRVFTQTTDKEVVIERNVIKPMAPVKVVLEAPKFVYSHDEGELDGWNAGLFGGEGTYIMGKTHGDNGYLMTIGNITEENSAIIYMDESGQLRELFIDNTIMTFGENNNGAIDVSIIEKDGVEVMEHISLNVNSRRSRSSGDHGQQIGSINLVDNLKDLYDVTQDIIKDGGFTKKTAINYVGTKIEALNNLIRAAGGPDLLGEFWGELGPWLDKTENIGNLKELALMYKKGATIGGTAGAVLSVYAGLYTTYLELYDEHVKAFFGNNTVDIEDIVFEGNSLKIELNVNDSEPWYDIECGVIVQENSFPAPRYSVELPTKEVVNNGEYIFSVNIPRDGVYYCRPFLITKDRATLWKGYIGEMIGPLVRYGDTKKYEPEPVDGIILSYENTRISKKGKACFIDVDVTAKCLVENQQEYITDWGVYCILDNGERLKFSIGNQDMEKKITCSYPVSLEYFNMNVTSDSIWVKDYRTFGIYIYKGGLETYLDKDDHIQTVGDKWPTIGEAIDLGLSVKWASYNVGANSPADYGGLYGWGDPSGTLIYQPWNSNYPNYVKDYKLCLSFYGGSNPPTNISGTELDIATAKWGAPWKLPTYSQSQELVDECYWIETVYMGVKGLLVIGMNLNSIFLPYSGYYDKEGTIPLERGSRVLCWTGTLVPSNNDYAFTTDNHGTGHGGTRCDGHSVRPVCP